MGCPPLMATTVSESRLQCAAAFRVKKTLLGEANTATLIAHRDFSDVVPDETVKALSRVSLGLETVTELDYRVNIKDKTPETAADGWFDVHPETVEWWLTGDTRE